MLTEIEFSSILNRWDDARIASFRIFMLNNSSLTPPWMFQLVIWGQIITKNDFSDPWSLWNEVSSFWVEDFQVLKGDNITAPTLDFLYVCSLGC